ncbi:MAG: N-6 DNA methylase [Candidatus Electryonea clarkiae]|nr:N-6 DNA methylase [Candidatus Electryonea clarkiae]MDP8289297.1 N-6 DNA methylase [Candidatus Electryonea clarkiae]
MTATQGDLFQVFSTARYGDKPKHPNLFLHKYLEKAGWNKTLKGKRQDKAHEIFVKWAELESSGKLETRKESNLENDFISDIFYEALGYTHFSEGMDNWEFEPKFTVNGGIADAALGLFKHNKKVSPQAVIELKGPKVNVDRDRFRGRTAIQQCWDYLNELPDCHWGIVSNFVSFRIYHRNHTPRVFQLFTLQDLRDREVFNQFYYIFERSGLIPPTLRRKSRAELLLEQSFNRQLEIGDELYNNYHYNRIKLIQHLLQPPFNKTLDGSIRIAQKLLDRIIFIAFCEDRGLLPDKSIEKAHNRIPPFTYVTNPRWQNFLDLFKSIDQGNKNIGIPPYDGGLFKQDDEVDNLNLDDHWTDFFQSVGNYDFKDEVNVEVLGQLFEKSINDIEKIRLKGIFEEKVELDQPQMKKSAERKRGGIYYTPPQFTEFIVFNVVTKIIEERFAKVSEKLNIETNDLDSSEPDNNQAEYWRSCLAELRNITIVDPACGSGAFLIKAYEILEVKYQEVIYNLLYHDCDADETLKEQIADFILNDNLFGVDLSPEAVEITQLSLWIRSAKEEKKLSDLSRNIISGNSIIVDPDIDPSAMRWEEKFPEVFNRDNKGFDCVIGNPPWERIKLQEREFFDIVEPEIASAVNAATRRKLIEKLKKNNPELYAKYNKAKESAEKQLDYVRKSGEFPLTGKGDTNTYAVFAELTRKIVADFGLIGILVKTGIATDHSTKSFFNDLVQRESLIGLYDFENRNFEGQKKVFPDVDGREKFCILLMSGKARKPKTADFVFFSHSMKEIREKRNHISLSKNDLKLLNPNTLTCPIFRSIRDAELTKDIYRSVPILVDRNREEGGNPWGIRFQRMFDQTNDAELFRTKEELKTDKFKPAGANWKKGKATYLPLYEAKMIQMYDHRAATVITKDINWMRQGQTISATLVEHQNPEYFMGPRWWVEESNVFKRIPEVSTTFFLGFKDITSPTNKRTMIASAIPKSAVTNHFPLIFTDHNPRLDMCLLANCNSFIFDYVLRQKIGGITLNYFIFEQLPVFHPDYYSQSCPWNKNVKLEDWISERVLKLSCTSNDMIPLAEETGFDPPVHKWNPEERAELKAELDAAYFILYKINREDVEYILSTFSGISEDEKDLFGSMSTKDRILKYYDEFL